MDEADDNNEDGEHRPPRDPEDFSSIQYLLREITRESIETVEDRLRRLLTDAGFDIIELSYSAPDDFLTYRMGRGSNRECGADDKADSSLRRVLNETGFRVGFEELALNFDGETLEGATPTRPLAELCREHDAAEGFGGNPET
jgi:hypothetical protein